VKIGRHRRERGPNLEHWSFADADEDDALGHQVRAPRHPTFMAYGHQGYYRKSTRRYLWAPPGSFVFARRSRYTDGRGGRTSLEIILAILPVRAHGHGRLHVLSRCDANSLTPLRVQRFLKVSMIAGTYCFSQIATVCMAEPLLDLARTTRGQFATALFAAMMRVVADRRSYRGAGIERSRPTSHACRIRNTRWAVPAGPTVVAYLRA